MIKRIRKLTGSKLPAPPLGSGGYRKCRLAALVMILESSKVVQRCQPMLPRQFHQRM